MINVLINYENALNYALLMEAKIRQYSHQYRDLSHTKQEKSLYDKDMEAGKRSFHENSNWTLDEFTKYMDDIKKLQYKEYLLLCNFLTSCKTQNNGYLYLTNSVNKELIHIKPSFLESYAKAVEKELDRMES